MRRGNQRAIALAVTALLWLNGCGGQGKADPKAEAPPRADVERGQDLNVVQVDRPE